MIRFQRAFTIVELIIVMTIMLITIGSGAIAFGHYNEENKLVAAAEELVSTLRLASTKARVGDAGSFSRSSVCAAMTGYDVAISPTLYTLNFCCAGNCNRPVHTYILGSNISIDTGYTDTTTVVVRFHTLSTDLVSGERGMVEVHHLTSVPSLAKINTETIIKVKHLVINQCININVTSGGVVKAGKRFTAGC